MSGQSTISITLPPELLAQAQERARLESQSMDDVFREALRTYIATDPEWIALLGRTRAAGKALGVSTEADVERLSDEFRREKNRHKAG